MDTYTGTVTPPSKEANAYAEAEELTSKLPPAEGTQSWEEERVP
jgi:hypothetical protein